VNTVNGGTISSSNRNVVSLFGFVIGAGAEINLGNFGLGNILLRAEYLHYDFGKLDALSNTVLTIDRGPVRADVIRSGLSLQF
jgi:opacity protein-like surface antigen